MYVFLNVVEIYLRNLISFMITQIYCYNNWKHDLFAVDPITPVGNYCVLRFTLGTY